MGTCTLNVELPKEIVDLLGSPQVAAAKAREALVIELLREAIISQGRAARLLGLDRWQMTDFAAEHQIPSGPLMPEEARQEFDDLHRYVTETRPDAGYQ